MLCTLLVSCGPQAKESDQAANGGIEANEIAGRWIMRNVFDKNTEKKGGFSIQIMTSSDTGPEAKDQVFQVEAGIRDGKLTGCQVSENGKVTEDAKCNLENGHFRVILGTQEASVVFDMAKGKDGAIAGESFMNSRALPGGRVKLGKVSLSKAPD